MIGAADLQALEQEVASALRTGDAGGLRILGHGEISLVLGWPPDDPRVACKRLPPFRSGADFEIYASVVRDYIRQLTDRGVRVVETELVHLVRPDGRAVGFHVQPVLPSEALGTEVLRRSQPVDRHPLLEAVVEAVVEATSDRLGIDAQLSNWMWLDGVAWQLDLTTPFALDRHGRPAFDLKPFLAALPAVVRPLVRHQMTQLIHRWTSPRGALLDMAANLLKEELDGWLQPALDEVNRRVEPAVSPADALRVHASDRRLWPVLLRLERTNRWWQSTVRGRTYEFLLPERTTYEERHAGAT